VPIFALQVGVGYFAMFSPFPTFEGDEAGRTQSNGSFFYF